ncbi:MAG TPA: hypothetical protein VJL61_13975 [Rhodanobacteraceae bacterium]|nr:hypothetical protein [Rhodanobacteraceae bacterium]
MLGFAFARPNLRLLRAAASGNDEMQALILLVIPESRSDIRDPATLHLVRYAKVTGSRLSPG